MEPLNNNSISRPGLLGGPVGTQSHNSSPQPYLSVPLLNSSESRHNKVLAALFDTSTLPSNRRLRRNEERRRAKILANEVKREARRKETARRLAHREYMNEYMSEYRKVSREQLRYLQREKAIETNGWYRLKVKHGTGKVATFQEWKDSGFYDNYDEEQHYIVRRDVSQFWHIDNIYLTKRHNEYGKLLPPPLAKTAPACFTPRPSPHVGGYTKPHPKYLARDKDPGS